MRKFATVLLTALSLLTLNATADITGNWDVDIDFDDTSLPGGGIDCAFKQTGEQLSGSCMESEVTGEVKGQNVSWRLQKKDSSPEAAFTGTVNEVGNNMTGTFSLGDKRGRFTASRQR